ncbi:MAG: Hsp20/alpha crystallin family protein [Pseudobdellovibrionaceae bacterium]
MKNPIDQWRSHSPLREMQRQIDRLDRLFEEFSPLGRTADVGLTGAVHPRCDMTEDANNYFLKFEMPGVPKENIKVEVNNNSLVVSAERKEETKKEEERKYYSEFSYGSYFRSLTLPMQVDEKKIEASYENGVLSVKIPKVEGTKAKQIPIH